MAKYRAGALILLRKLLKKRGKPHELVFLRLLAPEDEEVYRTAEHMKWIPVEQAAQILITAAQVLSPRDPWALRKLGREEAKDNLRGVFKKRSGPYSVFVILLQVARIWRNYHDQGRAKAVVEADGSGNSFVVENYPALPEANREIWAGFIQEAVEMAGYPTLDVRRRETNPLAWKWFVAERQPGD